MPAPKSTSQGKKSRVSAFLQPPLNRFFVPPPSLPYLPPLDRGIDNKQGWIISGIGKYIGCLRKDPSIVTTDNTTSTGDHSSPWNPREDSKVVGNPYRTLFVGRLSYATTEHQLRRMFEEYGSILSVRIVCDREGKSRGYGFVVFENMEDLKDAYFDADGRRLNQRRMVVDVERGRTSEEWKPRRFGGGLGKTRSGDGTHRKSYGRDPSGKQPWFSRKRHEHDEDSLEEGEIRVFKR